jgi:transposase
VLKVEDWAEIRRLHRAEDLSINEIVRRLGVSRNTVGAAVRSDSPPEFNRQPRRSAVASFGAEIRRLLSEHPRKCRPTVIAERIGWSKG